MLTDKYLTGVPAGSRASLNDSFRTSFLTEDVIARLRALDALARKRGQSLAQMAIAWAVRDSRVTSALVGASSVEQLRDSLQALRHLDFTAQELAEIEELAVDANTNLWAPRTR